LKKSFKVIKVFTNNIVHANDEQNQEVFLIGKGVGFKRSNKDIISSDEIERVFILKDKQEQKLYKQLIEQTDIELIDLTQEIISLIQSQVDKPLNEHIHIALTDHISFLVQRCKLSITIENPFIYETSALYPIETVISEQIVDLIEKRLNIKVPFGEVGFITLHIISSIKNDTFASTQKVSSLILDLTKLIESDLLITIDKNSLNYTRLVTHLRFSVERICRKEFLKVPKEFEDVFKNEYTKCFKLANTLFEYMQKELKTTIDSSEVFYLSLHLYRFYNTNENSIM
jgi:transcriptional antiterminator